MIKAIIEGRKTVTRRLIMPQPKKGTVRVIKSCALNVWQSRWIVDARGIYPNSQPTDILGDLHRCRYHTGETVYIKEAWCEDYFGDNIIYKLDGKESPGGFWRSPLFLPEKLARYFIKIIDVRPERLQEITFEEIVKEGWDGRHAEFYVPDNPYVENSGAIKKDARLWYQELWDSINPKYPFSSNPWVWRIEFNLSNREVE